MSGYDLHATAILMRGISQMQMHGAPPEMIRRLEGAFSYCDKTGIVLRDESAALRASAKDAPHFQLTPSAAPVGVTQDE